MKYLLSLIIITLLPYHTEAQTVRHLDTIYANENNTVALFFPNPIRQGITGSGHFVFTYNREKQQYFGLLQATPGIDSNLLLISETGDVYSYLLAYKKNLDTFNYFIDLESAIGNEVPKTPMKPKAQTPIKTVINYDKLCSYALTNPRTIKRSSAHSQDISLTLKNLVYNNDALLFVMDIENNSTLDYNVNTLEISIRIRKKGKHKSMQKLSLKPLYKYNLPKRIDKKSKAIIVYVIPKFSISNEREVVISLQEDHGERNVDLKVGYRVVNAPN
ncbi:DUF4138 domain-containing protein [Formosa haliotis]|uniref:DUF4138 domain-containing protein n=1 Tax=Formosa haliotis TaxID=1555194 RepID=UPI000824D67A|nr:DUF4138 domain-containing protein [Formosa haliotis]